MTSCNGWPAAECFLTSANIPRGLLGAGGARERDDSDTPPSKGEELGLGGGSDGGKGPECSPRTKLALFYCFLCFLSCYLTDFEFQITFKGQY